jgi:Na+-driven multidrug efflux pump
MQRHAAHFGCMRALGDTGYASMIMTIMSGISLILDPLLIYGVGPLPGLGLPGGAAALSTAYVLTCGYSVYSLRYKRDALSPVLWHPGSAASWRRFMHIALPSMVSNQIPPVSGAIIGAPGASRLHVSVDVQLLDETGQAAVLK